MNSPAVATSEPVLTEGQRQALVKLLSDEDPGVYQSVRDKILSQGPAVELWLQPHALSSDPVVRRRVQEILSFLGRQAADNRFLSFCLKQGEDFSLEEAAWLLARTRYPEANAEAYQALLDGYAAELRERIDYSVAVEQILATINQYLFEDLGFTGNEEDYYDPDNSYLNRVLDRRTGNPISLCVVYLLLARRLGLPVAGIGLPGHFVCRYQSASSAMYIDAFNRGKVLTKADCVQYLTRSNYGFQEEYLLPVSSRRTLKRVCSNLHQIYSQHSQTEDAARFQRYLIALDR